MKKIMTMKNIFKRYFALLHNSTRVDFSPTIFHSLKNGESGWEKFPYGFPRNSLGKIRITFGLKQYLGT